MIAIFLVPFPVINCAKQCCVLASTLLSTMRSVLGIEVESDLTQS